MARIDRVESVIKREVARIIQQKLVDERIGFVSLLDVKIDPDFSVATIFYSQYGPKREREKTAVALRSAAGFIKGELGKVLQRRHIPNLVFKYDDSLRKGVELVEKINKLNVDQ